jgi:tRNA(Ile)-lysidine synthase
MRNPLPLERQLAAAWPRGVAGEEQVLVAVSGGPDSIALLQALVQLSPDAGRHLTVAHFNHRWRGEASDADERFVVELAKSLGLACHVDRQAETAIAAPDGLEAAAREARYKFLTATSERLGIRYVATGHTADDQAETILHHILRGTSISGLAGMSRVRLLSPAVTLVRPLLEVSREAVIEYLTALDQSWRDDVTNTDRALMRNRIRHELLPLLARDYAPGVVESLLRLGQVAGQVQAMIGPLATELLERTTISCSECEVVLDCDELVEKPIHLVRELLVEVWRRQRWRRQAMGMRQWQQLAELATSTSRERLTIMLPGAIRAERAGNLLTLTHA